MKCTVVSLKTIQDQGGRLDPAFYLRLAMVQNLRQEEQQTVELLRSQMAPEEAASLLKQMPLDLVVEQAGDLVLRGNRTWPPGKIRETLQKEYPYEALALVLDRLDEIEARLQTEKASIEHRETQVKAVKSVLKSSRRSSGP